MVDMQWPRIGGGVRCRRALVGLLALAAVAVMPSTALGAPGHARGAGARQQARNRYVRQLGGSASATHSADDGDLVGQMAAWDFERTAPAATLSGAALVSAQQEAQALPKSGGSWQEVTNLPYNAEPSNYTDPFWSNAGAGFSLVGGRTTALAQTSAGTWFAGTADGGVWRSADQGQHWTPTFDGMPSLAIGALAVDPADGSLWVGTGEANTSQDSYAGTGVYRSTDGGASYQRVGDDPSGNNPLVSHSVFQLTFDQHGDAYAGTDDGLFRYDAGTGKWTEVLAPAPSSDPTPYYDNQVTSVAIVPGSRGTDVIAAVGWRSADESTSGFYESTDGGLHFSQVKLLGDINASDIGRTTFAYSADGSRLYAIVESPKMLNAGDVSNLQGLFVANGTGGRPASVAGPWSEIADAKKLSNSGSANAYGADSVGAQAWYNQDLAVDPANPNHVYAGLEEVFESTDGGKSWVTASPYWNYPFACESSGTCANATHPDQHAMMIADGKIVIGNDGGVYSRPLSDTQQYGDWTDLNATLRSWQYYDARAGSLGRHGLGVWGGLQDNGTSVIASGFSQMAEPAGGDGFDVIVDPQNANNMVGEYTNGTMYSSTDGSHSFADFVSPTCAAQHITGITERPDCDAGARFVTPIAQDQQNPDVWVLGGQDVWVSNAGWQTSCTDTACSWQNVFNTGAGNAVTAVSSANGGQTIYAAWVGGGGNPGPTFSRGIATNYGGTWHQLDVSSLPNRYVAGVTVDPSNPAHAYAVFNGYSRRWIPGGGVGHVFETLDGGQTWTDISGNLPDIASDALLLSHGALALATDQGVFTAAAGQGSATKWSRLGSGLPNASVNDLTPGPDGYIYAATHGRGIWRIPF